MPLLASSIARGLAACQRLALGHKLYVYWRLPHGVPLRRDSTGGGVTQAFPAGKQDIISGLNDSASRSNYAIVFIGALSV